MKKITLIASLVLALFLPIVGQAQTAATGSAAKKEAKPRLRPNSLDLLDNAMTHMNDARHALNESSTDPEHHKQRAMELLDQAQREVEAQKKALYSEAKENYEKKEDKK